MSCTLHIRQSHKTEEEKQEKNQVSSKPSALSITILCSIIFIFDKKKMNKRSMRSVIFKVLKPIIMNHTALVLSKHTDNVIYA